MKKLLQMLINQDPQVTHWLIKKISRRVPTQRFRRLTFTERIRLLGQNEQYIDSRLTRLLRNAIDTSQFERFASIDRRLERSGLGTSTGIGILEGQAISLALEPLARYFFPSSFTQLVGHLTGFEILSQFIPSPFTNLYLTRSTDSLAPRHMWGRFLYGQQYQIPRGRPTDGQRAFDGLLVAMNAESPQSLMKYVIMMAMVLFAKEMWRRNRANEDTGTSGETQPLLDSDGEQLLGHSGGEQSPLGEPTSSGEGRLTIDNLSSSQSVGSGQVGMLPAGWHRQAFHFLGLNRSAYRVLQQDILRLHWLVGRLAHVRCLICNSQFMCNETHAAHTIFRVQWSNDPVFPCPVCNAMNVEGAIVVLSICEVRIIRVSLLMQVLYEEAGFHQI